MSYYDFPTLKSITKITGTLVNETPLRVGSGETLLSSAVDIAVIRINYKGKEVPYIPGSSLKGVFRSFAESILASKGVPIHSPFESEKMDEEEQNKTVCEICGIFGGTHIASHVRIYDSYPKDPDSVSVIIKPGIAIDILYK